MISRTLLALGLAASTLGTLGGCAAKTDAVPMPVAAAADNVYTLGSGDKVRVIVYGEDQLSGEYNIGSAGDLSFPLIGSVSATGQTTTQLQETIRSRLAGGYIKQPRVSVEVLDYRPFFILGEVAKPGQYPYVNGMTVQQAVATAGGYTYRANTKRVFIKHPNNPQEFVAEVRENTPVPVRPGDTVRVAERFF